MKLGICYMVFDGEELLEFAIQSIRKNIDFISVTYQTTSYFGNPAHPDLLPLLQKLKSKNLIDELIFFQPNLKLHPKDNELKLRNIGLEASRTAGCTHHISADVDEFYKPDELEFAKNEIKDFDFSIAYYETYYKAPTLLVVPNQNLCITFIHSVKYSYDQHVPKFPFEVESTRRFSTYDNYKVFKKEEVIIHHMSYVRKDIRRKLNNSDNGRCYNLHKFFDKFDTYKIGDRVCIAPDFLNRKTIPVENIFNINFQGE